jgi:hypothetical protein
MIIMTILIFLFSIGIMSSGVLAVKYTHVYGKCIQTSHILCFSTLVIVIAFHIETNCPRALPELQIMKRIDRDQTSECQELGVGRKGKLRGGQERFGRFRKFLEHTHEERWDCALPLERGSEWY